MRGGVSPYPCTWSRTMAVQLPMRMQAQGLGCFYDYSLIPSFSNDLGTDFLSHGSRPHIRKTSHFLILAAFGYTAVSPYLYLGPCCP